MTLGQQRLLQWRSSSKNDIQEVNTYNENDSLPVISAFDFEYIFSDSGSVRAKLTSPFMEKYEETLINIGLQSLLSPFFWLIVISAWVTINQAPPGVSRGKLMHTINSVCTSARAKLQPKKTVDV